MTQTRFDLEGRTYVFAVNVALFCKSIARTVLNVEYIQQVVRSSGSIGANYVEANDALGRKDFLMHIKICRKEAKETLYWLQLIIATNDQANQETGSQLIQEAIELKKIFSAIIIKLQISE